MKQKKLQQIGVMGFALLITGAVDGVGNLPSIAIFNTKIIFFLLAAAVFFLIPISLIAAEFSFAFPEGKGVYTWSKKAFGVHTSVFTIWLQWINTMVWFPTCLSTIAGPAAYLIDPALAQNKYYLVTVSLSVFWGMTLLNLKGLHMSTKIASLGTLIGVGIPFGIVIILSGVWMATGQPSHFHLTATNAFPSFSATSSWTTLTAIITAFLGMELATVHLNEIQNGAKIFSKALAISVFLILFSLGLGSVGLATVLPQDKISLVSGSVQAIDYFLSVYHLQHFTSLLTLFLVCGSLGAMINWLISPAKGLFQAAEDGFLPAAFVKKNKHGVPGVLLLCQAVVVSITSCAFFVMPSVNGSYWLLLALSTQLYVIMYVLMLLAAIKLAKPLYQKTKTKIIPGGQWGLILIALIGLVGCGITLVVGFFKPDQVNVGSTLHYELMFCGGLVGMLLPVIGFYGYKKCCCVNAR